jgi:hypothetical protein
MQLRDVSEAWVHGGRSAPNATVHVRISGRQTGPVKISDNWCRPPARLIAVDPDVPAGRIVAD